MTTHRARAAALQSLVLCAVLGQSLITLAPPAGACNVPVYQYTLERWPREPCYIYYLYVGAEDPADAPVNRYLERVAADAEGHANIHLVRVDVDAVSPESPRGHRILSQRYEGRKLPLHAIITPRLRELFAGRLSLQDAKALTDSPKRRELAAQLSDGKQGLLLLLTAGDEAQPKAAREKIAEALEVAEEYELDVGLVEVARDAPEETWLVRQLLEIEDDLAGIDETMLFAVFGRAHVEAPFVGDGITTQGILDMIGFMNGPCTCTLRAAATGIDLITNWDWDSHVGEWEPAEEWPTEAGGTVTF